MNAFLLPCGCGADIPVTKAQAGGRVTCQACGRDEQVPKFRDLGKLREASAPRTDDRDRSRRTWTAMHTLLLAGSLLAATCGLGSLTITPPVAETFDAKTLRASVMQAPLDEVYAAWKTRLSPAGIDRPRTDSEAKAHARTDFYTTLRDGLRGAAALGAILAIAGGLGALAGARKGAGR